MAFLSLIVVACVGFLATEVTSYADFGLPASHVPAGRVPVGRVPAGRVPVNPGVPFGLRPVPDCRPSTRASPNASHKSEGGACAPLGLRSDSCGVGFECCRVTSRGSVPYPFICEDIDDCASDPCENGGRCIDRVNDFQCRCRAGYAGKRCEENIDDCASDPCLNGGRCRDLVNDFQCSCRSGFRGKRCEIRVDPCASRPCKNGGWCSARGNNFVCECRPHYSGKTCEIYH